ncbi:vascular endothelial growth factor receptor 1-like isoform X3 [Zophobas morio]|uniref:vascular endothelial growth factor receptor 1-like isoform X3 n=1 Tax=Zophobas morio TaxID=2755281 RepID=UPI003082EC7E
MGSKSLFCVNLFLFLLSLCVLALGHGKPEILSEYEETILESGDNFTVLCQGQTPLRWRWPMVEDEEYQKWTTISEIEVLPKKANYKYARKLFIQNITYPYTGFYQCLDKNVESFDDNDGSSIYLYVRDQEHLSVSDAEVETVTVTQYDEAVIPCRPTSPDVDVKLTLIGGEAIDNATYNPKTGFRFHVGYLSDQGLYCCNFLFGSSEYEQCIYLNVIQINHFLPKPSMKELSGGHTIVGDKLILECRIRSSTYVNIVWTTPTGPPDSNRMSLSTQQKIPGQTILTQNLTINETILKDKGMFYCNVSDNQNHASLGSLNVTVYAPTEHFINLTEDNNVYTISAMAGDDAVVWRINVDGHPEPKLFWLNNRNETIIPMTSDKYDVTFSATDAVIKIKDISITDYGNYTLLAENGYENDTISLFLNVTDKPLVHLEGSTYHMVNEKDTIKCIVAAYPPATIYWSFKPCSDNSCTFHMMNETRSFKKGLQVISSLEIKSLNTGYVKCLAVNSIGEDSAVNAYYVTDVKNGFDIFGFDPTVNVDLQKNTIEVAVGESMNVICGVSVHNYTSDLKWIRNNQLMKYGDRYRIDKSRTEYTNRAVLNLEKVQSADTGTYSCQVKRKDGKSLFKNMTLIVSELSKPVIVSTNLKKDMELRLPNSVEFYCKVKGVPKPVILWYRNNEKLHPSNRTHFKNDGQYMNIVSLDFKDEGAYKCEVSNKAGRVSREVNLKFKNKPDTNNLYLWITIVVLCMLAFLFCIGMTIKIRNEKKLQRELRIAGLANFEKGAIESLNPDLAIDDQAELLPYDKKWEFPIEKLKLGKQLGSGAFGVVMKGVAKGIVDGEESTTVAVKMVKKNADHTYIKALASELKIMVHLGKHLNVVNLLGACTKNVAKRELLVIVEFCRFGNIQNYLLRHRENFIDQVDPKTCHIDYTIGQEELERTYSVSSNRSNSQSPYMKYAALSFSQNSGPPVAHMVDYRGNNYNGATGKTDITMVSMSPSSGDDEVILSNNSSVQPEWRSNYHGDYKGNIKPICTKDLLAWAFQVSRGMEYLASRRVLHGDLAARNILLADHNVVKICDFGLAKSMYKSDNYKKKGDGPLPVKWMAIESIRDKVFSTQSDVWSFGIVLWEFFSLARTPYPGMEADERLYNKLLDGYRMESPEYSPKEIYKMMLDCWHAKPINRPSFSKLSERIGSLLEDTVRKHYIDLNDPYLVMNTQRLEEGHSDYLAMLSPPNFENLSSPRNYVNDLAPSDDTSGYLSMNSAHIFSPRADEDRVFSFDVSGKTNKRSEEGTGNELIPMLRIQSESDGDSSSCNSPVAPNSFSNPSYHLPPIVERDQVISDKDIVKSSDNYVNMPQNKTVLRDSNPFLSKVEKNGKDNNYVNSNSRDWESVKL